MQQSMSRKSILQLFCMVLLLFGTEVYGGIFPWTGDDFLLKMDETEYSTVDFRNWWQNWKEKDMPFPETVDPYVDWLLFIREAERMRLFEDPSFHHGVQVYIKVLSLVQLQNEEVREKVTITDEKLREFYYGQYVPVWLFNIIAVEDKATAVALHTDLLADRITVDALAAFSESKKKNPHGNPPVAPVQEDTEALAKRYPQLETHLVDVHRKVQRRPIKNDERWNEILHGLDKGSYSEPFAWQDNFIIVQLLDEFTGGEEDFEKNRKEVERRYRKHMEGVLTYQLIERLKEKYGVKIDENLLDRIDLQEVETAAYSEAPLVTIGDLSISEKEVIARVREDITKNKQYGFTGINNRAVLDNVINSIIGQTLITLESLDRHYEKQSPIKELVEFKKKHSLYKLIDRQVREQAGQVADEEVRRFYEEHKDEFSSPEVFQIALIKGEEDDLNKVWLEAVVNGKDVLQAAEERLGAKPYIQSYPGDHLDPEVRKTAKTLSKGDISQVFKTEDGFAMIYFTGYTPSKTAPFESIKKKIQQKLVNEKYEESKKKYLEDLRKNTTIVVNDTVWQELKKEFVETK